MIDFYNRSEIDPPLDSTARDNESLGILEFGKGNLFPAKLVDNVSASSVMSRCIEVLYKFIVGDGFEDQSLNDVIINDEGYTLGEYHQDVCLDMAYFEGVYSNVKYNLNKNITEIYHLPFENCRLGKLNDIGKVQDIFYNAQWGQVSGAQDSEEKQKFDLFNPELVESQIQEQGVGYKGQVLYSFIKRPQRRIYPVPLYYSAENWIKIDGKISQFHINNIDNNFLLSVLIKIVGDPNDRPLIEKVDKDGKVTVEQNKKTYAQLFDDKMSEDFGGSPNGGKVMVLWAKMKEAFPEIQAFPTNSNHDLFITLQNQLTDAICVAAGIPRILANIQTAGKLGDSQEIENAVIYMQGNAESIQAKIEDHYKKIFSVHSNPILKGITPKIKKFKYVFDNNSRLPQQGQDII